MYIYDKNERVPAQGTLLFLGDSITDGGRFVAFVNTYLRLFHSNLKLNVVNLGVSSENCSGLSEQDHPFPRPCVHDRIDRILQEVKPDFTVVSYGVNDMIYHPFSIDRMYAFTRGMTALVDKLHAVGSKVFVCTPCAFDPVSFKGELIQSDKGGNYSYMAPYAEYNAVLERLAAWEKTELAESVEGIVDWYRITKLRTNQFYQADPNFAWGDGIHPGDRISAVMAQEFLLQIFNLSIPRFWDLMKADGLGLYRLVAERDLLTHNYIKEKVGHTNPEKAKALTQEELQVQLGEKNAQIDTYITDHPELLAGFKDKYHGFDFHAFWLDGYQVNVVLPEKALPGNPWVWKTEFLGEFPDAEIALLKAGFHVVNYNICNLFGLPEAVEKMERFYPVIVERYNLQSKMILMGLSRGGLYATRFAARNPHLVAGMYLDAPVIRAESWPLWAPAMAIENYRLCKAIVDSAEIDLEKNYTQTMESLTKEKLPVLIVYGEDDWVVPFRDNGLLLQKAMEAAGAPITVIGKPGIGHHPHGLDDSTPIVKFALELLD